MTVTPENIPVKGIFSFIWWIFTNRKKLIEFINLLQNVQERMTKIELQLNDPAYFCTLCKKETRILLSTRYVTGQLTGIYYCTICERVSERPTSEKVTMQNSQTTEIINKLKEQGYDFNDIQWKQRPINRGSSSGWDVYG